MRFACAFAWLGGVERFLGADARIRFHAASNAASDGERGVIPYLTKIGLPYEAIIYVTEAAPNEMTWLNMSDAAQRGGAIGSPARRYYVLLVDQDGVTELTSPDFQSSDGTFKVTHRNDEFHFTLGHKKSATYKKGSIAVDIRGPGPEATLLKKGMHGDFQYGCDMCSTAGVQ